MRNQQRAVCGSTYFSVIPDQSCYQKKNNHERQSIIQNLYNQLNRQKKHLETLGCIIVIGSLCLGGTYMFLHQLAQYGW